MFGTWKELAYFACIMSISSMLCYLTVLVQLYLFHTMGEEAYCALWALLAFLGSVVGIPIFVTFYIVAKCEDEMDY